MQKKKIIPSEFAKLIDWISVEYGVKPINICYEIITTGIPRLEIVFEEKEEDNMFRDEHNLFYDKTKQQAIKKEFINILNSEKKHVRIKYNYNKLLIITSAFKPVAIREANNNIAKEQISNLKEKYSTHGLWEISRFLKAVTFFFYTDEQMKEFEKSDIAESIKLDYFKLLKQHDIFDYVQKENYQIFFDSKENLDNNFKGSWQYYYK